MGMGKAARIVCQIERNTSLGNKCKRKLLAPKGEKQKSQIWEALAHLSLALEIPASFSCASLSSSSCLQVPFVDCAVLVSAACACTCTVACAPSS
eukprot:6491493-Amphidinium_carterae.1